MKRAGRAKNVPHIAAGLPKKHKRLDKPCETRYKKGVVPKRAAGFSGRAITKGNGARPSRNFDRRLRRRLGRGSRERMIQVVFERIRQILCDQLDLEEEKVTMESDIVEDLEADSLDVVDLVMTIEDEFGIEVPDDQIEGFRAVGDVVRYIEENITKE